MLLKPEKLLSEASEASRLQPTAWWLLSEVLGLLPDALGRLPEASRLLQCFRTATRSFRTVTRSFRTASHHDGYFSFNLLFLELISLSKFQTEPWKQGSWPRAFKRWYNMQYLGKYLKFEDQNFYHSKVIAKKQTNLNSIMYADKIIYIFAHTSIFILHLACLLPSQKDIQVLSTIFFLLIRFFLVVNLDFQKTSRNFVGFLNLETLTSKIKILAYELKTLLISCNLTSWAVGRWLKLILVLL